MRRRFAPMRKPGHDDPAPSVTATPEARSRAAGRDTAALLVSRVAIASMGWLGSILIARALSPTDFGQFSFVFGLLGLLSVVTDLGVGRVVLARLVDETDPDVPLIASSFIALRALLGGIGYAVALAYVWLAGYPGEVQLATAVAGVVVLVATPSHAFSVLFQARLKLTVVAAAEAFGQVLQLLLTVVIALTSPLLLLLVLPAIANELLKLALKVRGVLRGDAGPRPARQLDLWRWRGMLADAVPLTLGFALLTLMNKVDILLLGQLDTFDSVGLYSVGYKFADVLSLVATAVAAPATTLLMAMWPGDAQGFRDRTRNTFLLLAMIGSVVLAGFWASAGPIVTLLYGDRFGPATDSTRLLVAAAVLGMLSQIALTVLIAAGKQRIYPLVGVLGLAANVGLNLVLIPRYSYPGAAVATLVTDVVVLLVLLVVVQRSLAVPRLIPVGKLAVVAATTGGTVLLSEAFRGLPWVLVSVAAAAISLAVAAALDLPLVRTAARRAARPFGRRG